LEYKNYLYIFIKYHPFDTICWYNTAMIEKSLNSEFVGVLDYR